MAGKTSNQDKKEHIMLLTTKWVDEILLLE
jgi:hypothetical protein